MEMPPTASAGTVTSSSQGLTMVRFVETCVFGTNAYARTPANSAKPVASMNAVGIG